MSVRSSRLRSLALALLLSGAFAPAALAQSLPTFYTVTGLNLHEGAPVGNHACHVLRTEGTTQNSPLSVNLRISQTGDFLAPGETGDKTFLRNTGRSEFYNFTVDDDDVDELDGTITCKLLPGDGYVIDSARGNSPSLISSVIRDDDPTIVTLARVGSGPVREGGSVEFTVTLGRELVAGEIVDVPLDISGGRPTRGDWRLVKKNVAGFNTGVRLRPESSQIVSFQGAGARAARLVLMPLHDAETEGTVTYTVALESDATFDRARFRTNVGGGADPHASQNSFSVPVNDVAVPAGCTSSTNHPLPGCVWITGSNAVREGDSVTFTVHADPPPPADLDVTFVIHDATELNDYLRGRDDGPVTLTIPKGGTSASWTVPTMNDRTNEEHGQVRAEMRYKALHPGGPDRKIANEADFYYGTRNPRIAWVSVLDNDPPPLPHIPPKISIEVLPVSGSAAKGGYASFCTTVDDFYEHTPRSHELGWFHVDVEVRTSTGVWVRGSAQQFRTGQTGRLCSRIDTTPWAGQTLIARVLPAPRWIFFHGRHVTPYVPGASPTATLTVAPAPAGLSFATRPRMVAEFIKDVNLGVDIVPPASSSFDLAFTLEGTATPGVDYIIPDVSGSGGTVAVPAGAGRVYIPVTIIDDTIEDDGETIIVRLQASGGYDPAWPNFVTVTVRNDDPDPAPDEDGDRDAPETPDYTDYRTVVNYLIEVRDNPQNTAVKGNAVHVAKWNRVLAAIGYTASPEEPMPASEIHANAAKWPDSPFKAASVYLMSLEQPHDDPVIAVSAGTSPVTEGGDTAFTLTASPAPAADLPVNVNVAADGDWGVAAGSRTVTIPTSGSATLTLPTTGDDADEPDGSVTVTVAAGDGYTVGSSASGTVSVQDDDAPACAARQAVADILIAARDNPPNAAMRGNSAHIAKWNRVLATIGYTASPEEPMPASEIHTNAAKWPDSPFKAASDHLNCVEAQGGQDRQQDPQQDRQEPEITVSAGSAVTEGGSATFTLTATPAPAAPLPVNVTVAVQGAYGITAGSQTLTIPTTGSATLTLATTDDATDEPDGSVSVTLADGDGWTAGDPASGTVAVRDDDAALPVVTLSAGAAVTEGGYAVFTLTASPAPAADLSVSVTVAATGDWGVTAGTQTVTIPTTGSATLTLATADDATDEPDGSVTATVDDGSGYTVGASASGTVAVRDDDLPPPAVTIAAMAGSVTEGGNAVFTLTADRAPSADLTVTLAVSENGEGDHVAASDEGPASVTIPKDATESVFTLATVNDDLDEPDGAVTVTVTACAGCTAGDPASASVEVKDDDITVLPSLSVADVTAREGVDWLAAFTVRLSAPSAETVEVRVDTRPSTPVSAQPGPDYYPKPVGGHRLLFRAGETEKPVRVLVLDDSHDEDPETFEFVLSDAKGATIGDGVAVGTIVNDDPMPAAWLARFGRTVAEQALDAIARRMSALRTPGMQGAIAGHAVDFGSTESGTPAAEGVPRSGSGAGAGTALATDEAALAMADIARSFGSYSGHDPAGIGNGPGFLSPGSMSGTGGTGFGRTPPQSQTMTARAALLGSSFSLTGQRDGSGGSMAFWGRAAQGSFDGREGSFSLDGTATTAMLGADYARGRLLIGLALAQSGGEGDYRDSDIMPRAASQDCPDGAEELCRNAVRAGDGKVEAALTAALPYAALQVSERLKLWAAAGYGTGEVTLKTALGARYGADTSWTMAAAGMRGDLLAPPADRSGPALAATSDALWSRTSSEKTRDLAASDSDVTRLRIALEGSYHVALGGGGTLTLKLEPGARHDGGDAETGFGVELGGGLAWTDPRMGLSLDLSGRTLLAHDNDDLKDRGFSAVLAYDSAPATMRGASLSLRQDFGGKATGGLDALFQPAALVDRTGNASTSRWAVEAAYGLPAFGGRWTASPHVGFGLATGARDYSLGWRLAPEAANVPDLSFGVNATRRERDTHAAEHTLGVELTARW